MLPRPLFIGSEIYRPSRYGAQHPLGIPRVSAAMDLCRALGWLPDDAVHRQPDGNARSARALPRPRLHRGGDGGRSGRSASMRRQRERHNIGRNGNPIFGEVFRRPATACGASLMARGCCATAASSIRRRRHASWTARSRLRLLLFQRSGSRPSWRCSTRGCSASAMSTRRPSRRRRRGGFAGDAARAARSRSTRTGAGRAPAASRIAPAARARNLPVPAGFNDSETRFLCDEAVLPLAARLRRTRWSCNAAPTRSPTIR